MRSSTTNERFQSAIQHLKIALKPTDCSWISLTVPRPLPNNGALPMPTRPPPCGQLSQAVLKARGIEWTRDYRWQQPTPVVTLLTGEVVIDWWGLIVADTKGGDGEARASYR
eukprot:2340035-Pleurochrysis_carterae.AAC.2